MARVRAFAGPASTPAAPAPELVELAPEVQHVEAAAWPYPPVAETVEAVPAQEVAPVEVVQAVEAPKRTPRPTPKPAEPVAPPAVGSTETALLDMLVQDFVRSGEAATSAGRNLGAAAFIAELDYVALRITLIRLALGAAS